MGNEPRRKETTVSNPTHAVHVRLKSALGHDEIVAIMNQRAVAHLRRRHRETRGGTRSSAEMRAPVSIVDARGGLVVLAGGDVDPAEQGFARWFELGREPVGSLLAEQLPRQRGEAVGVVLDACAQRQPLG